MKEPTSLWRVLTALGHREPDRVPFVLLATMHGAKELGVSLREYFSRAENVVEGQVRLRAKYRHDCVCAFFYAAIEVEAWGGEVLYRDDGPANAGEPIVRKLSQIKSLDVPKIAEAACLVKVLEATRMLKARVGEDAPVIGVVISPFSLPVMQMGFGPYIELIYERPELFARLMRVNQEFCVAWANAQLEAGATVICYVDPVSSTTIIPRGLYLETGLPIAQRTLARIKGPTAVHMASGRCQGIVDDLVRTGATALGVSALEDLATLKAACRGKITVLGNLNGVEMRHWTPEKAVTAVRKAVAKAGPGGGFILSDNHGEIPLQVPDEVLLAVSQAVHKWGRYPIAWTNDHA